MMSSEQTGQDSVSSLFLAFFPKDFIHRPGIKNKLRKNTTFRKLDLFPSTGLGPVIEASSF
jgi:hypothetical protein